MTLGQLICTGAWLLGGFACTFTAVDPAVGSPKALASSVPLTFVGSQMGLALPSDWLVRTLLGGWILSGPEQDLSFYTTVTVQELAHQEPLDALLETSFADLRALPNFKWLYQGLVVVGDAVGLEYTATYDLHEVPRYQTGCLIPGPSQTLSLTYLAPYPLAAAGLAPYLEMLASLQR